jgi:CheY-like chemotaxis protein/DNA-binding MarR family transcriptional regulator
MSSLRMERPTSPPSELQVEDFRALAEWRHQIRKFLAFSEEAARSVGLEPQQHQLLLAIKGLPEGFSPTITGIAERMAVRHHTVVELVDRLVARGIVKREPSPVDRRSVLVTLTPRADRLIRLLSDEHRSQLRCSGPALVEAISRVLEGKSPAPTPAGEALHVLCVDDEPRVLQGLRLNLEPHYRVSTAESGAEALAVCEADRPAVIISDLRMPGMDGTSFLNRVRDRTPGTVRILLTGHADVDAAIAAVNQAGVFRFLTKPCRPNMLLGTLEEATAEHRTLVGDRTVGP